MSLHIHAFVIETIRLFAPVATTIEKRDRSLGDQMRRALASVALNLSEGAGSRRGNQRLRFENACGSAKESRSAYEVAAPRSNRRHDLEAHSLSSAPQNTKKSFSLSPS